MDSKFETYIDDDIVNVTFEESRDTLFLHVDVKVATLSAFRYMRALWEQIKMDVYLSGYDELYCYTPNLKFVDVFSKDYQYFGHDEVTDTDVIGWEIKSWA